MPILIPIAPYDPVDTILNFARVIANDAQLSISGNLLSDTQPYTYTIMNLAWRKLQDRLGNNAIESFPAEIIFTGVPVINNAVQGDPASRIYIGFSNFFDGATLLGAPILPPDLEIPTRMWERPTGVNSQFIEMIKSQDGIVDQPKTSLNSQWEWRDDALYFPGSLQSVDIRMRYKRFIADVASSGTAQVPLLRAAVALAYLVVEIFAQSRGSSFSTAFSQEKELAIRQLVNSSVRAQQRSNFRRQPYSRRGSRLNW